MLKLSPGQIGEMNREKFTTFDRSARTIFTRMLLHVCKTTDPNKRENMTDMNLTKHTHLHDGEDESVSLNGPLLSNFIKEWFRPDDGHLVKIQCWFAYRNENMKKTMRSAEDTLNEENLSDFIKTYIAVNMQSSVSSLQPRVYIILKSLLDQKTFKTALYQTIDVICSDYAALIVPGPRIATPEISMGEMQYWEENKTFDFFIFTLIASLHSFTYNKSQPLTSKLKWLVNQRNVKHELLSGFTNEVNLCHIKTSNKAGSRKGNILPRCLEHFCELISYQKGH